MRAVIDTNCLLVSISPKSKYHWLFQAFLEHKFTLCLSNEVLTEYVELIDRYFSSETAQPVYQLLLRAENTIRVEVFYKWPLITSDPDDDKFVECAFAANADVIVTEDKHYAVLADIGFPKFVVVNLERFQQLLDSEQRQTR